MEKFYKKIMEKRFIVIFLIISAVVTIGFNMKIKADNTEYDLKETFKALDAEDYKIQSLVGKENDLREAAEEIFEQPQLGKVLNYLQEMKRKGICFKVSSVNYDNIQVTDYSSEEAVLIVKTTVKGGYYSIKEPEKKIKEVDLSSSYRVYMVNRDNKWKIRDIESI